MAIHIDKHGQIIRNNEPVTSSAPVRNVYSVPYRNSNPEIHPVIFYIITFSVSMVAAWLLAAFVSVNIFNSLGTSGISGFFRTFGPYLVFLGSIAGVLFYNLKFAYDYNVKEIIISFLSGIAGCLALGIAVFIAAIIIQIIIGIIIIGIVLSFFTGG